MCREIRKFGFLYTLILIPNASDYFKINILPGDVRMLYLLADVGKWNVGDGIPQKDVAYILYCVDIDSGEITLVSALDG